MGLNQLTHSGEENIIPEITLTEKEMVLEVENYLAEQGIVDVKVLSAEQIKDEENTNSIQIRFQYTNTNDEKGDIDVHTLSLKNILNIKVSREKAERRANRPAGLNDYLDSQEQELFDLKWRKYKEGVERDQQLMADKLAKTIKNGGDISDMNILLSNLPSIDNTFLSIDSKNMMLNIVKGPFYDSKFTESYDESGLLSSDTQMTIYYTVNGIRISEAEYQIYIKEGMQGVYNHRKS